MSARGLRIGLDIGFLATTAEGIRHWTERVFGELIRQNPDHEFVLIWPWAHADPGVADALRAVNTRFFSLRPRVLWRRAGRRLGVLDEACRAARELASLDVLHWNMYSESLFPWIERLPGTAKVVTLYDATPFTAAQHHTAATIEIWSQHLQRVRELGSAWITISEHAYQDLVRVCGLPAQTGRRIYPGHNFDRPGIGNPAPASPLPLAGVEGRPYVLTVGMIEPRKNHLRLIRAFSRAVGRPGLGDWRLVIVGRPGWQSEEILTAARGNPSVILAGRLSAEDLAAAYRGAAFVAYPSEYEGFGLPVAEAMSFGKAVLTSQTSSLPEVAGNAGLLVDPLDEGALESGLVRLMQDDRLRHELGRLGPAQAGTFSWAQAGRETMAFLEELAAVRRG